jgi:hypothetical protein
MDNIPDQGIGYKPVHENRGWQFDNLAAVRTGPIFGGRTISAMGNRPQDHMDRDLLLASLLREYRLPMFRKQCLELPAWAPAVPEGIPARFQHQAQELIMLGSTHQYLIERMRASLDLAADQDKAEQMLKAMEACPPRGALFPRTTLDTARPCGYARLCPWCHARSVQRLYGQLRAGPCTLERLTGNLLIAIRVRVGTGEDIQACEVREARNEYRYQLRRVAREIDIDGGVMIHQVTPWIPWYNRPEEKRKGFAHLFTIIGTVDSRGIETLDEAIEAACSGEDYNTIRLPADTPHALRYLLFGSSYKFKSRALDIVASHRKALRFGIPGAAALQPWFIFDERQAWSYVAAIQDTRLYDTFGNWRESQADQKRCSRKRRAPSEDGEENRQWAFESTNARKHRDAEARRRQLAVIALPFFQKFKDAGGKRLGSPALRKMLEAAGYDVSDRDARWLAKNLPARDTRTAFEKFVARRTLELESRSKMVYQPQDQENVSVA